jgi:hypothetical protein
MTMLKPSTAPTSRRTALRKSTISNAIKRPNLT